MSRSDHEAAIAKLHAWYCGRTGVVTKLIFSQRLCHDRLRDYGYDADKLRADADLIIRHLKREIARDKRNLGALKPANFLQPDNFDADLAIARLAEKKSPRATVTKDTTDRMAEASKTAEDEWLASTAKLKEFRKSLGTGGTGS